MVNTVTNRMVRLLGKDEASRFTCLALYQGAPRRKEITNLAMAASENPLLAEAEVIDPILFCTAFRKARFYMFTLDDPEYVPHHQLFWTWVRRLIVGRQREIGMCIMRSLHGMIGRRK